jgi:uncharacterized membrane protein YeaQ/YmgE (transglycosylase-associated protein family)
MIHFFGISVSQSLVAWIIIGLLEGWIAGLLSRGAGFGCIGDILIGLVGSILGGWIFSRLHILGGGFVFSLAAAVVGAVILVAFARLLTGSRRRPIV